MAGLQDLIRDLTNYSNPFGSPSDKQWNLSRGVFTQIETGTNLVFFYETPSVDEYKNKTSMEQAQDSGGRRIAVYEMPYRDGQLVADLGRKGEQFVFNIKFFGENYQKRFNEFIQKVVNYSGSSTIIHPVRGAISAKFKDYEFMHRHDEWNAVTIRATFVEDSTGDIKSLNTEEKATTDTILRTGLSALSGFQNALYQAISDASALMLLPGAIQNAMNQRVASITGAASRLLGQLAATFSSDANLQRLSAQSKNVDGGITSLSSGSVLVTDDGGSQLAKLPPVYQVGFDPTTQELIDSQLADFISSSQITPQEAVFQANQIRAQIKAAIENAESTLSAYSFDVVLNYRGLANSIQQSTESAISSAQSKVKKFYIDQPMSLRMVAKKNGLSYDRQNEIEALNPYLPSVNYIPEGTTVLVPAS